MRKITLMSAIMLVLGLCPQAYSLFGSSSSIGELDAQGPYGTPTSPFYEGDFVLFEAGIINGDLSDYYFRWDINSDGTWEKDDFGAIKGNPTLSYQYPDEYIGNAKVEAWDGTSYLEITENRAILNETLPSSFESPGISELKTIGMKFEVKHDLVVNQLGLYNDLFNAYVSIYNIRLWTDSWILITSISFPESPSGEWSWFDIVPVTLFSGESYIVSIGVKGYLVPTDINPDATLDGYITPLDFLYNNGSPFVPPTTFHKSSVLPLVDIRYEFTYPVPDILYDYADVYVTNVAPIVSAGPDVTSIIGEPVFFHGSFLDPGLIDIHVVEWNFGDNNIESGSLEPNHTFSAPGIYNVILTVTDDDGGVGWDHVVVNVVNNNTVSQNIQKLIDDIGDMDIQGGIKTSLTSKLENAQMNHERGNLKSSINIISAFINHVNALEGKKISEIDSKQIIHIALLIIAQINAGM